MISIILELSVSAWMALVALKPQTFIYKSNVSNYRVLVIHLSVCLYVYPSVCLLPACLRGWCIAELAAYFPIYAGVKFYCYNYYM